MSGVGEGGCGDTSSLDYEALLRLLRNAETTNSLRRIFVQDTNLVAAKLVANREIRI